MPKVQVPRERILQTALQLLIREGEGAVTISRLARELGCSTQPISWTFGSMEHFREEFAQYVLDYLNSRQDAQGKNPVQFFGAVGVRYLQAALEEPNLIHFVRNNSRNFVSHGGIGTVFDKVKNEQLRCSLSDFLGISEDAAAEFMQISITYTQGLVSLIVDGTITVTLEQAIDMVQEVGIIYLVYQGIPREKAQDTCRLL